MPVTASPTPSRRTRADRRGRRRFVGLTAVAAAAVLTLSGCITLDMGLSVQEDDTVDGTIVLAVDKAALELLGEDPEAVFGDTAPDDLFGSDLGGGSVSSEVYDQDGKYGQRITFDGVPLETFSDSTSEADGDSLVIAREGDFFVLDGTLDLSDAAGGIGADAGATDELTEQVLESLDFRVAVTFPGEVVETNGELDGTTVTWRPQPGEKVVMQAKARTSGGAVPGDGSGAGSGAGSGTAVDGSDAEPAASTSPVLPWAIAALALLALAGLLVVFVRRGAKSGAVSPIDQPRSTTADDDDPFLLGGAGAPAAADLGRPDLASPPAHDTVVLPDDLRTDVLDHPAPGDERPPA